MCASVGMSVLTGRAVDAVSSRFTVLARGAMETLVATTLPVSTVTVLTLPVIGAPAANVSGAFEALVTKVTRATGEILQDTPSARLLLLFLILRLKHELGKVMARCHQTRVSVM